MFTEVKETLKNQKGIIMKITRILTYKFDEEYVRDFFPIDWWEDVNEVGANEKIEFEKIIFSDSADDEQILYENGIEEKMKKIWQTECDNYHKAQEDPEAKREQILNELQHYKSELEYYKNKVAQLEDCLKDA